jgi:hypothetical protein
MVAVVDSRRFGAGLLVVLAALAFAFLFELSVVWPLVLVGLAFVADGLTAKRCPNDHLIYLWSRLGRSTLNCPTCGEPLKKDELNVGPDVWTRAGQDEDYGNEFSREKREI